MLCSSAVLFSQAKGSATGADRIHTNNAHGDSVVVLVEYPSPTILRQPCLQWHKPAIQVSSYYIQIATDTSFATPVVYVSAADTFYTPVIDLPVDTIYWRVKADQSKWSETGLFVIRDGRIPVLIAFENPTFELKPFLRWHIPPIPVTQYTVQIATDPSFVSLEIDTQVTDTFYACAVDLPVGMIYWRVKSDDSEFSGKSSFEIKDPRVPILIPYEPHITIETQPALTWRHVNGTPSYTIEIDNNIDFSSTILSLPLSDTSFTPFEPLPFGNIYWRVKSALTDIWSGLGSIVVVPDTIPLLVRFDGKITTDKKPVFVWHSVNGADAYKFRLADNANFTGSITVQSSDTVYVPGDDLALGTWFWKVSCSRNFNVYCPVDSFIIDSVNTPINHINLACKPGISMIQHNGSIQIVIEGVLNKPVTGHVYNLSGKLIATVKPILSQSGRVRLFYSVPPESSVSSAIHLLHIIVNGYQYSYKILVGK